MGYHDGPPDGGKSGPEVGAAEEEEEVVAEVVVAGTSCGWRRDTWHRSCTAWAALYGHIEHVYGFSPVWIRWCRRSSAGLLKPFPQM